MIDITFKPLHGQDEIAIAGIIFKADETISFGDGSNAYTDDDAERILTNPNFVDAELGRNPNYTCKCGNPVQAYAIDRDLGNVRTGNRDCGNPACSADRDDGDSEQHADDSEQHVDEAEHAQALEPEPQPNATEEHSDDAAPSHVDES